MSAMPRPQHWVGRERSRASRSALRRRLWFRHRSDRFSVFPADRIWLLARICTAIVSRSGCYGAFARSFLQVDSVAGGAPAAPRDHFPLAPFSGDLGRPHGMLTMRWRLFRDFLNCVVAGLNYLYGMPMTSSSLRRHSDGQCFVLRRIADKGLDFLNRLERVSESETMVLMPLWATTTGPPPSPVSANFKACYVDVASCSGSCDPLPCLEGKVQELLIHPDELFKSAPPGLNKFESLNVQDRFEYVLLVTRQLRANKIGLAYDIRGGGQTFYLTKKDSPMLREVWHGARVSAAAVPPPCPPHLASPSVFPYLEASDSNKLRVSQRDARTYFDQLVLPAELSVWMARPPVSLHELVEVGGLQPHEVRACMIDGGAADGDEHVLSLFPVAKSWPMGFSWSSFVGQSFLLSVCKQAGLERDALLASDIPTPPGTRPSFAVATDDVMIFSTGPAGTTTALAARLDDAMARANLTKHEGKDVNDATDAICVGVALEDGVKFAAPPSRCMSLLLLVLLLAERGHASPSEVMQVLGTLQWFDLLLRLKLSVYDVVYKFTADDTDRIRRRLPGDHTILGSAELPPNDP